MIIMLLLLFALALAFAAWRWGANSIDRIDSPEWDLYQQRYD